MVATKKLNLKVKQVSTPIVPGKRKKLLTPIGSNKKKQLLAPIILEQSAGISTSNQFGSLSELNEMDATSSSSNTQTANMHSVVNKPPPIVVTISDFSVFRSELSSFVWDVKISFQIGKREDCCVLAVKNCWL